MDYLINYRDIKSQKPQTLRSRLRSVALDSLSILNRINGYDSVLKTPRVQFLYIHHVFKDEEANLIKLLQKLGEYHEFISYSDAVTKIVTASIDKPYIVFSSDDGFKNNLKAARLFTDFGISACFFINPSIIEQTSFELIKRHCADRLHFPPVEFLNWADVAQLQAWGHEIGSHTMNHINVADTDINVFTDDCRKSIHILNERCGGVNHFAYPYGRFFHFSKAAHEAVFQAGFNSCASAERGCHINHTHSINHSDLLIRRDQVILDWDINHVLYFIATNSRKAMIQTNLYPDNK